MRTLLRRRLKDQAVINWDDGELNTMLNEGSSWVQKEIVKADPAAFVVITHQHIQAGVNRYPKPQGIWSLIDVARKNSTTGVYSSLGAPVDVRTVRGLQAGAASTVTRYAILGNEIMIGPTPTAALNDGLEWTWVQSATMSEDDDVSPIHIALHNAIVLRAHILLMAETNSSEAAELRKQLQEEMEDIPTYYRRTAGQEMPLMPMIVKGY
jgi:hypothetical protein